MNFRAALKPAPATIVCLVLLSWMPGALVAQPTRHSAAATGQITPRGVDGVTLGKKYTELRAEHLVGRIRKGCELGGPDTRSAPLLAPLDGGVDFTTSSSRRVRNISVTGGATARGVGIGAKIDGVTKAFPRAKVDHTTEKTFGITLVRVPRGGGGKLDFAVDLKTKRVSLIGIPSIAFCE